jgi:hypothetical protein
MNKLIFLFLNLLFLLCYSKYEVWGQKALNEMRSIQSYGGYDVPYYNIPIVIGYIILNTSSKIKIIKHYRGKLTPKSLFLQTPNTFVIDTIFNSDTLEGLVKLCVVNQSYRRNSTDIWYNNIHFFPNNIDKYMLYIPCKNIKMIIVNYNEKENKVNDKTPLKHLIWIPDKKFGLLRLVQSKGDYKIYDNYIYTGKIDTTYKKFGKIMFIENKDNKQMIYDHLHCPIQLSRRWILNFINNNYHQQFTKKDFASTKEMLNYILDKESEREENKNKISN